MILRTLSFSTFTFLVILNVFEVYIDDVHAGYHDNCTQQDASNCTSPPGLTCTPANICDCLIGRMQFIPDKNVSACRIQYSPMAIVSKTITATTIMIVWDGEGPESGIDYNVNWVPRDGELVYVSPEGCRILNLHPDTLYNLTVVSELSEDRYYPAGPYYGPSLNFCTPSLFGGICSTCGECQGDLEYCTPALDTSKRCLCDADYFNATDTGNCTSMEELIVTNITINPYTTSVDITWVPKDVSYPISYQIMMFPADGHVDIVTNNRAHVSGLNPGSSHYVFVDSTIQGNAYVEDQTRSSPEIKFWTDIPYLGNCEPYDNSKECQDETVCKKAEDQNFHCICDTDFYFNDTLNVCSSIEDLQISDVLSTVTATSASFSWAERKLSVFVNYTLEWFPSGGKLDSITFSSAKVSGLTSRTLYNFTIVTNIPADSFYPKRNISYDFSVITKSVYNQTCDPTIGCQNEEDCVAVSGKYICQCDSKSEYYNATSGQCESKPELDESCDITIGCQPVYQCTGTPPTCQCNSSDIYFDSSTYQCLPLKDLAVTIMYVTVTATTITFRWGEANPDADISYDMLWTPPGGGVDFTSLEEGQVSGLQPGTKYNFTIVTNLFADPRDTPKKYFVPNVIVYTHVLPGGQCGGNYTCQDTNTTCIQSTDKTYRCLCNLTAGYSTQSGACVSLSSPEKSSNNDVKLGVGLGVGCFVLIVVVVVVVVIYRRRTQTAVSRQRFTEEEYVDTGDNRTGDNLPIVSEEHSMGKEPGDNGRNATGPVEKISLDNVLSE